MELKHKRGDVREDGMVFLRYRKYRGNKECWVTQAQFDFEIVRHRENQRKRYQSSEIVRSKNKAYGQAWAKANADRVRAYKKQWEAQNQDKVRDRARRKGLQRGYGITIPEYDKMLTTQNGVCAICLRTCPTGKRLAVDHSHVNGKVRGLLCQGCNTSLGKFNDDFNLVQRAADYLKRHSSTPNEPTNTP